MSHSCEGPSHGCRSIDRPVKYCAIILPTLCNDDAIYLVLPHLDRYKLLNKLFELNIPSLSKTSNNNYISSSIQRVSLIYI